MQIKQNRADFIFTVFNYVFLFVCSSVVMYPLIYIISSSFSSVHAVASGRVWFFPVEFSLEGYKAVFADTRVWMGFRNTVFYTSVGTCINLVMTVLAAYPLSRRDFSGRNFFTFLFAFTTMFSGGIIPSYLLVRDLGIENTRLAMLLPGAMSVWNMIITRTYFQSNIPGELLEASQLDGCDNFKFLARIVLPLSGPILAVITLYYMVGHWNAYMSAIIYLKSERLYPLQIFLRNILMQAQISTENMDIESKQALQDLRELLKYSLIVVASVPMLAVYPFVQKYFVKGIMIGAIKG